MKNTGNRLPVQNDKGLRIAAHAASLLALAWLATSCTTPSDTLSLGMQEPASRDSKSDDYPDFSAPLKSAMEQMSDEEARQMQAELATLGASRKNGTISEAEYWKRVRELQALASQHGTDTVSAIESGE